MALFNGYYDSWCYLPILGFISFNDEVEQYLFTAVLRAGNAPAKLGAVGILRRVIDRLRDAFPGVRIQVRLDGGFACPEVLDFLDEQSQLSYIVAVAKKQGLGASCQDADANRTTAFSQEQGNRARSRTLLVRRQEVVA